MMSSPRDEWCAGLCHGWRGVIVGACLGAAALEVIGPLLVRVLLLLLPGLPLP